MTKPRWRLLFAWLLLASGSAAAPTEDPALDGRWDVQLEGAARSGVIQFFLRSEGRSLTGRREAAGEPMIPVVGEMTDNGVVLRFTAPESDFVLPVEIRATLVGDRLDGEATLALPDGRRMSRGWSAVRVDAGASPSASSSDAGPTSVAGVLAAILERTDWPGITVAWRRADGSSGAEVAGVADRQAGTPMTVESRMPAGSVGKTLTSAVTLQLAAEGIVDLDAPVSEVLGERPWFADVPNAADLTLRRLLQHSGGLPDHVDDADFAALAPVLLADPEQPAAPEALIATVADNPPLFPAGTGYHYSDTGYLLVGLVIEAVTGRSWWELLREKALEPAGLEHSQPQDRRDFPQLATGYASVRFVPELPEVVVQDGALVFHPGSEWTGGGVVSTAADLARWGSLLFGGRFLPAAALAEMINSRAPGSVYGLGVREETTAWGSSWGHDGWFPGYRSKLVYLPQRKIALAVQVNTDRNVDLDRVVRSILAVLEPLD